MTDTNTAEREAFEAQFNVPDGVRWDGAEYVVKESYINSYRCDRFVGQWAAFLAGRASLAASAGSEPVAWRYVPSKVWGDKVFTDDPVRAEDARQAGCIVEPLYTLPSPPEGMAGWTKASEQLPPCRDNQLYIGVNSAGFAGVFNAVTSIAGNVYCHYETAEESIDVLGDLAIWKQFNPPLPASEAKEL